MAGSTERIAFKRTVVHDDIVSASIADVAAALRSSQRLAIVVDYAVGWDDSVRAVTNVAVALDADVYAAPFHVQGVCDMLHPTFKGALPPTTREVRDILSGYDTVLLLGEKIDTFTYTGDQAVPPEVRLIQIAPATDQLGFDWPVDIAVVGDITDQPRPASATALGSRRRRADRRDEPVPIWPSCAPPHPPGPTRSIQRAHPRRPRDSSTRPPTHVVTEGSSEDQLVQQMATSMGFRNVHFSPRGGALGWAMPLAVGLTLGTGQPAVCFVGDGGSLFSVHAIWTAAALKLPVVVVCFVNHEYRLLKDLWVSFTGGTFDTTRFVGLDFDDPALDLEAIMRGFGAVTARPTPVDDVVELVAAARQRHGPTVLFVDRRP